MNYVITGSLGHISKPVVNKLVKSGHNVIVITSSKDRAKDIEALGARAAAGSLEDVPFLTKTFSGADAVYLMIPSNRALTGSWLDYQKKIADNYVLAVKDNGIKKIVLLSSVGAHLRKNVGPVDGLGYAEEKLSELKYADVIFLRPSYFYYNLFAQVPMVKNMNIFGANYGSTDEKLVLTHTEDIAEIVIEELLSLRFKGKTVRYIASDERHPKEVAAILGNAVGKPNTPWVEFKDADALNGMLQRGLNKTIAEGYVQLGVSMREGKMQEDYWKNQPVLSKTKLEDFAMEFATVYNN